MLPPEDQKALRDKGFKYSGNKAISPLIRPLQNPFTKFFSSEAQPHRHREREPINNSRATQPKATPIASNNRLHSSADAEERRRTGSSLKPKRTPPSNPFASNNRLHSSADAEERRRTGSSLKPKRTPPSNPFASNTRLHSSADAEERRRTGSSPKPQLAIASRGEQNKNNVLNQTSNVVKGTAVGAFVASRKLQLPQSYPPLPPSWADRVERLGVVRKSPNDIRTNSAIGRMTERVWEEHLNRRPDVKEVISQRTWRDPDTRKTIVFPDGKRRRPDFLVRLKNGKNHVEEIKATPYAAETRDSLKQQSRDRIAQTKGALLGRGNDLVMPDHVNYRIGLPILGPGGNTALPGAGEVQKHVIITPTRPDLESRAAKTTLNAARAVGESRAAQGVLRGVSRVAAPIGVGLDAWQLGSAYKKDGFGQEFRKTAGSVAGGWGGAAAGAAIGSFAGPPGMIVGGIIGGVAGSEFGDDIEQGAEKAAKGIAQGAKKVGEGIAQGAGKAAEEGKKIVGKLNPFG